MYITNIPTKYIPPNPPTESSPYPSCTKVPSKLF